MLNAAWLIDKKPLPGCAPDKGKKNGLRVIRQCPDVDVPGDQTLRE